MKLKFIPVLVSAIAFGLVTVPVLAPIVQAQDTGSSAPMRPMKGRLMQELNLTTEQQAQIRQIREETRAQMEQILTPEQRQQLQDAKAQAQNNQGQRRRGMKANLNLTDAQKTQMRELKESAQRRVEAVLTAEQRQKLEAGRQMRRQMWEQKRQQQQGQPGQPQ